MSWSKYQFSFARPFNSFASPTQKVKVTQGEHLFTVQKPFGNIYSFVNILVKGSVSFQSNGRRCKYKIGSDYHLVTSFTLSRKDGVLTLVRSLFLKGQRFLKAEEFVEMQRYYNTVGYQQHISD